MKHQHHSMDTINIFNLVHGELKKRSFISWIFLPRVICGSGEGWKDSLLMVIPMYASKFKKSSPSSTIQESHGLPFNLILVPFKKKPTSDQSLG